MSTPSFSKEDFAKWNQTTSVFYLPKRLVGKSKVTSLRSELVKAIGESKVSVVQALPGLKFRVCFVSSSFRQYYDINGLNFRGLTITPFPAYEEVKSVFVDRAPPQMPDKYLYDCLAPYGRVISVKHLTIKGFPSVQSGTRMVSMVIEKAIPAEIRTMGFQLSFRYRGQPPTCFACQEVGHTARDCPKSSKRGDKGRTKPSKPGKASATTSLNVPALSGSLNSSSPSSSHPRDLREKLAHSKPAAVTPVGSGEDPVTLPASQPQSPLVEVVEVVPVATSSPSASLVEAGTSLQRESFDFSLEFSPDAPVVSESSSGWSKQFDRSVRRTGKDSLEIVVSSSAPRLGPKLINTPTTKSNGVPNNTSPTLKVKVGAKSKSKLINKPENKLTKSTSTHTKAGGTSNNSSKQAKPAAKSSSKLARGVGAKSVRASSSSSSASEDEDNIPLRHRSKKLRKSSLPSTLSSGMPPSGVAQVLPSPAASPAPAEVMEEDVDACLTGDSVVDPVGEESVPAVAVAEPHAAPAHMDEDSVPSQTVEVDDTAASQDCPSWPFSSPQSELGSYLDGSLSFLQDDSLGSLFDDPGDVSASSTCTSSGDQGYADQLQELVRELPAGTRASDVEPPLPQH